MFSSQSCVVYLTGPLIAISSRVCFRDGTNFSLLHRREGCWHEIESKFADELNRARKPSEPRMKRENIPQHKIHPPTISHEAGSHKKKSPHVNPKTALSIR